MEVERDPLDFSKSVEGKDYGIVRPGWNGRWQWPLSIMEPGDYFHVAHDDKAPGNLRHLVSVRAAQLGANFSVRKDSPALAGHSLVICAPPKEVREALQGATSVIEYGTAKRKIAECYAGIDLDKAPWGVIENWKEAFVEGRRIAEPMQPRYVFTMVNNTIGVELLSNGVRLMRLPNGATPKQWDVMESEWDRQRAEWEAKQEEERQREEALRPVEPKVSVAEFLLNDRPSPPIDEVMS